MHRPAGRGGAALCVAAALAAGCGGDPPPPPPPEPSRTALVSTLARAELGDRLTLTATVVEVLGPRSFVVRDVDLTNDRLLVLTDGPVDVRRPDLVTVSGTVVRFTYQRYAGELPLGEQSRYEAFEGSKALRATEVRSRA